LEPCPASSTAPAVAGGLPDVTLPCLGSGPDVRLSGLSGEPTIVNVWASWCLPCRQELPLLAAAAASTRVRVIGVDATDDPASALTLLQASGVHYPSVRDDTGSTRASLQWASGLPVSLLVDASGRVVHVQHGPIASAGDLAALLHDHLGVSLGS
jgi:cytochrome c biogenesis protein CcmG, thiol:disulfide interchange protein DsbE